MTKKNKLITAANFRDFDWNKAKLFYHVAKCGSFTKAARLAGTDRTALTRQIQMLEKQIGSTLLARKAGSGSVILTRKGEELLKKVAPFFLDMKGFCGNHHTDVDGEMKRKIRIVTTQPLADYVIGDFIIAYGKNNPQIIFEIIAENHEIDIILNDADIAIRPFDPRVAGVQQEHLFTFEKKLFASDEYIEKFGEPQIVSDLDRHHLITTNINNAQDYPYADIHWILKLGMPNGQLRKPIFMSNSIECRVNAAKNGIGIMAGYEEMSIIKNAKLKNILPEVKDKPIEEFFIYPIYIQDDPELINLKNYLKKELAFKFS